MTLYIYHFKLPSSNSRLTIPHYLRLFLMFTFSKAILSVISGHPCQHHIPTSPPPLHLSSLSPSLSSDRDRFHYCSQSGPSGQLLCSTVHLNIILLIKGLPPHHCCPAPASALFSHGASLLFTQALTHSLHVKPRSCHLKRGDVTFVSTPFMWL